MMVYRSRVPLNTIDHCAMKRQRFSCDEDVWTEIRAYSRVNCAMLTGELKDACIVSGAKSSASTYDK